MDNQQTPTAGTPIYQESQGKNAKWLWLLIILIIIGALIFAFVRGIGPFGGLGGGEEAGTSPTPLSIASPSPAAEASPTAGVDKSEPDIRVLNGTTTTGLASSVKTLLEGKGYRVVAIGNAASSDFEQTLLRFKRGFERFEDVLTDDLSGSYSVISSDSELEATDSADIEVVVGAR